MQKNSILIHELTPDQITSLFQGLQNQISELQKNYQPKEPAVYLTRDEVKAMLQVNISTIHNWTVNGTLIPYGIGNRVYFKRHEVEAALVPFGKNKGNNKV